MFGDLSKIRNLKYKYVANNIHLKDYISYKQIPKKLMQMDILLMPYVSAITAGGMLRYNKIYFSIEII